MILFTLVVAYVEFNTWLYYHGCGCSCGCSCGCGNGVCVCVCVWVSVKVFMCDFGSYCKQSIGKFPPRG